MEQHRVELETSHDGLVVTMSLPGGAFDGQSARELTAHAEELNEQRNVRVIVIEARTSQFCSGPAADLDRFDVNPAAAIGRLRPPVVCAIDGDCLSVGLELALAADVRLCTLAARFSMADIHKGHLPSWGGTQRLPRAIRPAEAAAMILTGSTLDAERAASLGLVHDAVDDLTAATEATVQTLVGLGPLALEFTKEAVHRGSELPLRDGLRLEGDLNHQLAATKDRAEGLQAFFDKRPPDFRGS